MAAPTFSQAATTTSFSTATTSHTISGVSVSAVTDGVGIFCIERNDGITTDIVTGATWSGAAMTPVISGGIVDPNALTRFYMFYILNPGSGTINISATSSSNMNARFWWYTIKDAAQQAPHATNSVNTASSTTNTIDVTTSVSDCLICGGGVARSNSNTPSAQSGTTIQMNHADAWFSWTSPQTTAGTNTSGLTGLSAASNNVAIAAAFAGVTPPATNNGNFFLCM